MLGFFKVRKQLHYPFKEVEYSEITEICYKILFIHAILLFMGVVAEYKIIVHIDNVKYILLPENTSAYKWTKHIDVRPHFISD